MINALELKNIDVLKKEGLDALSERLGPVGMVNFVRLFSSGYGDYSSERQDILDGVTENDFMNFMGK